MGQPRYCILNTALAGALGSDDRVKSELYYGNAQNGSEREGLRRFKNLAGFKSIIEYPDLDASGVHGGLAFDKRLACLSVRGLSDMSNIAKELGIPQVMDFRRATDKESDLSLTAVSWQQPGTGDVFVSIAILYGAFVGNNGGTALSGTDLAGLLIKTQ